MSASYSEAPDASWDALSSTPQMPTLPGQMPWDIASLNLARGPIEVDGCTCIGRVGAPPGQEANSVRLCFWIPEDALVEASQIVSIRSRIAGQDIRYFALVEEVHRSSRRRSMGQEVDEHDGDLAGDPEFAAEGITYATAAILRADPPLLTPPRERSPVMQATEEEARQAYGTDEAENPLAIGLIKNGGSDTIGPGSIDTDYLLGANGGHLNVNGAAGRGTKSSFLLHVVYLLLAEAQRQAVALPSDGERLRIVPIVFNVKGYDLFYIDQTSIRYNVDEHAPAWNRLGIAEPGPFQTTGYDAGGNPTNPLGTRFFAPQQPGSNNAIPIPGRNNDAIAPYSWGLADIVAGGLLRYLFSGEDINDNFLALLLELEEWLTEETVNGNLVQRALRERLNASNEPLNTFERLAEWARDATLVRSTLGQEHAVGTVRKMARLLRLIVLNSRGVLRRNEPGGNPLAVQRGETSGPIVIDLNGLSGLPDMQRFVVGSVLQQLVQAQTTSPVPGLKYLVVIDELNRFAPRGGRDPLTRLVELVASEMRSQGVLLFGAQQQASLVSEKVIENAGIRALGKTGMLELSNAVWRALSASAKTRADGLRQSEKLVLQDTFRQPMHIEVPFPPWAMRRAEAAQASLPNAEPLEAFMDN